MAIAILLLLSLLFVYPFALYPVVLRMLVRRRGPAGVKQIADAELPPIAMVVCALNEERVIRAKVENCLELAYPPGKLRFVFVSDGSTDRTAEIVSEYRDRGVQLIDRKQRRGKVANLNEVIPALREEIVVLSDANVIYDPNALRFLVSRFADPLIGCVSGKVVLCNTTEEFRSSEEGYYSIEWTLQERASELYSMCGADGAMYAFRRSLFQAPPNDTIIEDFVIPMGVVRQGKRAILEPRALAWEDGPTTLGEEYRRKVRIAAGAAQSLVRRNGLPSGAPGRMWFIFFSHKLLRWFAPVFGLLALIVAAATWRQPLSELMLAGFGLIAVLAAFRALTGWTNPLLNAPFYFLFSQIAVLNGLIKGATGRQTVLWKKANR